MRRTLLVALTVVTAVAWQPREGAAAPTEEAGEPSPVFRPARPPSKVALHRMERWHEVWRSRAGTLERAVEALAGNGREAPRMPEEKCTELAAALLDLDRRAVLPVPESAVSLHLERGLRLLTRTAITCITRRRYAARRALLEARRSFAQAERLLRRYELGPANLGALAR